MAKNLKLRKIDDGFEKLMKEKNHLLNSELRPKLRKPLSMPDTQRIARILWGDGIYRSLFNEEGKLRIRKDKKGSVFDILFIFMWFFIAAVFFIIIIVAWNEIHDNFTFSTATGQQVADTFENDIKPQYDFMLLGIYFGAAIVTFILGYLIRMHRIFIVVAFVFATATFILSSVLSNVYEEATSSGVLSTTAQESFKITGFVIDKFPIFYVVFALLVIFVMAASERLD